MARWGPVPGRGRGGGAGGAPQAVPGSSLSPPLAMALSSRPSAPLLFFSPLDPGVAARPLAHSLFRPLDSAAAPPLQLRLSQELPQRPDVTGAAAAAAAAPRTRGGRGRGGGPGVFGGGAAAHAPARAGP